MPFSVDDNLDPNNLPSGTNIRQAINILATQLKQLSGKSTWRAKPDYSIVTAVKGDKGDKGEPGATGAQGIQGQPGAKGEPGEPAPLDHQHAIAQVQGLQAALDDKSPASHQHQPGAWQNLQLSLNWRNFNPGYATPQCRKITEHLIEVKGVIKKTTNTIGDEVLVTLPQGYRPAEMIFVITWSGTSTIMSRLLVEPSGAVKFHSGNGSGVGLNFIFGLN